MRQALLIVVSLAITACATHRNSSLSATYGSLASIPAVGAENPVAVSQRAQAGLSPVAFATPSSTPRSFGIGSSREQVAAIMGPPRTLQRYAGLNRETWRYGLYGQSSVDFENGVVVGWDDTERIFPLHYTTFSSSSPATGVQLSPPTLPPASYRPPSPYTSRILTVQPAAVSVDDSTASSSESSVNLGEYYAGTGNSSYSSTRVRGYYRNGTYVVPHYRSTANRTTRDNWSTRGNRNLVTGKRGYRNP